MATLTKPTISPTRERIWKYLRDYHSGHIKAFPPDWYKCVDCGCAMNDQTFRHVSNRGVLCLKCADMDHSDIVRHGYKTVDGVRKKWEWMLKKGVPRGTA